MEPLRFGAYDETNIAVQESLRLRVNPMRNLLFLMLIFTKLGYGQSSVLTWHNDNARSGRNLEEAQLTPSNVNASTFGKLFTIPVDGLVDAEPLYVPNLSIPSQGIHNVLFVVTEHDSAYAFDADTGAQLWHVSLLSAGETTSDSRNCSQVTPEIGITSTPVIDLTIGPHGTIYVVAMSKTGSTYYQRLHALDITTGAEELGGPIVIEATYPKLGGGTSTFDPKQYKERAALLLWGGVVYLSFASHCDFSPYNGWVIGYNESNLSKASVLNLTPNGSLGSIWQAGAGPAADTNGNIFALMGNGTFDTTLDANGFPVNADYGNAFIKIAAGAAFVMDYFTMDNTVSESNGDVDLGSGGPMLLPPLIDSRGGLRTLAAGAGKDGNVYVVDRANMGKFMPNADGIFQQMNQVGGGVWSSPAWFNGSMYYGSVGQALMAFPFSGSFATAPASKSSHSFGYPGTTPSISANGVRNGIVWAAENTDPAVLHAYDSRNLATELYNSSQAPNGRDNFGAGNKYIAPLVANGKVYVGTTNGMGAFGFLDLAVNKNATQSSTYSPGFTDASNAVDGNTDGVYADGSLTHTLLDPNSWWQVDLGASATISSIVMWNRTDCCGFRLDDYWVFVSDTPFLPTDTPTTLQSRAGTFSTHQTSAPAPSSTVTIPGAQGRYVRVQLSNPNYLSLGEVQVYGTLSGPVLQDIALFKPATQSSTYAPGFTNASNGVDGNIDGNYYDGSLTHTLLDANAWWEVDLGAAAAVDSIAIWNRTDCCASRLSDYWVFVSNTSFAPADTPATLQNRAGTFSSHQTIEPSVNATITVAGAQGRYVRVQLNTTDYLSLGEVQVFGTFLNSPPPNLAQNKPATQSSTYLPGATDASAAVDGQTDGNFFDGFLTHTMLDTNAWWQVDLGTSTSIASIVVWNRTDGSGGRLSDYWVFVSDTPFSPSDTPATLQNRAGTFSSHQTVAPGPTSTIVIPGAQGRYVRVQLTGTNYLSLAEVQVFGN
jgi:hypothetical protein